MQSESWVESNSVGKALLSPTRIADVSRTTLDDRGRLTLPKSIRERFGDRYRIVELHDGVKLIPIAEDPLAALRDEFADSDRSTAELREAGREEMLDEAGR